MKVTADFKTEGKLLETITPDRKHRFLYTCGKIIENNIAGSGGTIDQLGLVDKGIFKATVDTLLPKGDRVVVTDNVYYGIFLEYGTRPHIINPKNKKALYWKGADHPVKKVMHPGTQSYRPFTKGLINSERGVVDKLMDLVKENQ